MKRKPFEPEFAIEVKRQEWERTLEGETVLHCVMMQPEGTGTWRGLGAINRCYQHVAEVWRRRWEQELYCAACLDLADRRAQGRPFRVWQAELVTEITLQQDGVLSLWQEGRETWGYERPLLLRRGDTWDLQTGAPRPLASFCSGQRGWKQNILDQMRQQIENRLADGESLLDADCTRKMRRHFNRESYYLTPEGANVFVPMYTIASGGEGIPVFTVTLPGR